LPGFVTLEEDGRIIGVYIVRNPEKAVSAGTEPHPAFPATLLQRSSSETERPAAH